MTDHFAMTVTRVRVDADTVGVKVRTCVLRLPDGWEGSVRVSPDPWSFLLGSGGVSVRAELDPRFGPVMRVQHLSVGECGSGWLTYDMSKSRTPSGLIYSNSLGEVAYF